MMRTQGEKKGSLDIDISAHSTASLRTCPKSKNNQPNELQHINGYIYGGEYGQHQLEKVPEDGFSHIFLMSVLV